MQYKRDMHTGDAFDKYTLLQRAAVGGQSDVWSAWDPDRKRVVAIKILTQYLSDEAEYGLSDEMSIISKLDHPQIVKVFSSHSDGSVPYLVMEYFALGSLAGLIKKGPLPLLETMRVFRCLVEALHYTHSQRVIHRDIKPTNILIDSQHRAYLMDFGIAKILSQSTVTLHTGHGTAHYASPEQHTLQAITPQSDIYSLGIILYEMLTGALPWRGDASHALKQITERIELPDPCDENPLLPEEMARGLRKITALTPENRPASVMEAWDILTAPLGETIASMKAPLRIDSEQTLAEDAEYLLRTEVDQWNVADEKMMTSLSQFAVMHSYYFDGREGLLDADSLDFMLAGSIVQDFHHDYWWRASLEKDRRLKVCERMITVEETAAITRTLRLMVDEPDLLHSGDTLSDLTATYLTGLIDTPDGKDALTLLERALRQAKEWAPISLSAIADLQLAAGALSDKPTQSSAARVIAHVKSESAVLEIAKSGERKKAAARVLEIWSEAHSLPKTLPISFRLRVWLTLIREVFTANTSAVLSNYGAAAAGCGLALGVTVFLGYRWLTILDATRLLNGIGSGLLFGPIIGFGVLLARLFPHRLKPLSRFSRGLIGALVGSLFIMLGFTGFHKLFLNNTPQGLIIFAASLIMGLGFAGAESAIKQRWLRISICTGAVILAFGISWLLFLTRGFSPILYYEVENPAQTIALIIASGVLMGAIPHTGVLLE